MTVILQIILMLSVMLAGPAAAAQAYGPYRATPVRVIDGDTVVMDIDIWPDVTYRLAVRIYGVDTAELHSRNTCERALAIKGRAFTAAWLARGGGITLDRVQLGKYAGRVVAEVKRGGDSLAADLIAAGLGHPYFGGRRAGWCLP
ncbi:thermonuclease family protein [Acidihalobacter prosperus]|uniref:TNase-like domain-containing protein n=1 Tax=Acidihalobacter prosperus TaxID=160660 RepID=A0A1A6C8A2_9GAMM|nr:hypothetical protein [Acidihalobacter prosperus]OBS10780.1 hypothetical protein Thpro_020496 [Acidihalobacter prosperus]